MFALDDILEFLIVYWFRDSVTETSQEASCKLISSSNASWGIIVPLGVRNPCQGWPEALSCMLL